MVVFYALNSIIERRDDRPALMTSRRKFQRARAVGSPQSPSQPHLRRDFMTWSLQEALDQRKRAVRCLLDGGGNQFTRSLEWYPLARTDVPLGIWTLLYQERLVHWYTPGGDCFRLTTAGWIEACRILRYEVDLDRRFGVLSAHLKNLTRNRTESFAMTSTQAIAESTGLPELWVFDAIEGSMAEIIYRQHGATLADRRGGVEVSAHIGNPL